MKQVHFSVNLVAVVGPHAELQRASLLIEGEVADVNLASRLEDACEVLTQQFVAFDKLGVIFMNRMFENRRT